MSSSVAAFLLITTTASTTLCVAAAAAGAAGGGLPHACTDAAAASFDYCNTAFPIDDRIQDLLPRLTPDEKITLLVNGASAVSLQGLPAYEWWSEALHGVGLSPGVTFVPPTKTATSFPAPVSLSHSFNSALVNMVASAISTEARVFNNYGHAGVTFWTPNINIFRDPRWGRGYETSGEDPFWTGNYATNFVRGMQEGEDPRYLKTSACCKHFAAYSVENLYNGTHRHNFDAHVSAQDMADTYLPAFEACVTKGRASGLMCSYNAINGVPACADAHLMTEVARGEWGFDGYITSDCGAIADIWNRHNYTTTETQTCQVALRAGCDLDCSDFYKQHCPGALAQGEINEEDLDTALRHLFRVQFRLGLFDPIEGQVYTSYGLDLLNSADHQALALKAARQGMVLLKNERGTLPLSVAGLWPRSSSVGGDDSEEEGEEIEEQEEQQQPRGGPQEEEQEEEGEDFTPLHDATTAIARAISSTKNTLLRHHQTLSHTQTHTTNSPPHLRRRRSSGSPHYFGLNPPQTYTRTHTHTHTQPSLAIIGPHANATDALLGNYFGIPPFVISPLQGLRHYLPSAVFAPGCGLNETHPALLQAAETAAHDADVSVLVLGIDRSIEDEGRDRHTLTLPQPQLDLAEAVLVAAKGKPVVLVLIAGGAVDISSFKDDGRVGAILFAGYPGQSGGQAIAEVIFGDYNPSGRLTQTFYPANFVERVEMGDMRMRAEEGGGEGGFPGRTYRFYEGEGEEGVVFPFGFGLSYSEFVVKEVECGPVVGGERREGEGNESDYAEEVVHLTTQSLEEPESEVLGRVCVQVTNRGPYAGRTVLLGFLSPPEGTGGGAPRKSLRAFGGVKLAPHDTVVAVMSFTEADVSLADEEGTFRRVPGKWKVAMEDVEVTFPVSAAAV